MRCSCRACGTYMVQVEHGLESGCKCPECGCMCRDCMGSAAGPMSIAALRAQMSQRMHTDMTGDSFGICDPLEAMRPDPDTD